MKSIKCERCGKVEDYITKPFEIKECKIELKIKTRDLFKFYEFDLCEECREELPVLIGKVVEKYVGKKEYWTYEEEMKGLEELKKRLKVQV